jgi:hypothetical protein
MLAELLAGPPAAYAGIGSRKTPPNVLKQMERLASRLCSRGWTLRSGGAPGADAAFERGAFRIRVSRTELFLPWPGFHGRRVGHVCPSVEAYALAERYHPNWQRLSGEARALVARNGHQVLGADLASPVGFVLCWTPDGATETTTRATGGTGQAIRIAVAHGIPVWNLQREDHRAEWERVVMG